MAPTARSLLAALGVAAVPLASASVNKVATTAAGDGVVRKVVKLLEEMKTRVETEADEDEEVYKKMQCWCKTGETEKTAAIKAAKLKLEELKAFIEEGGATVARLGTEIESLKASIADGQESLQKATGIREGEREEFAAEEADTKETLAALKDAVEVLSKVQLVQQQQQQPTEAAETAAAESLAQVRKIVQRIPRSNSKMYGEVIQKDLWALLGDFPEPASAQKSNFKRAVTGLSQQPMGGAAATSYSSQSSSIFGILQTMQEKTTKDLAASQKEEVMAEVAFQRLRSAKESEIAAATKSLEEKTAYLAETNAKVAQAHEDVEQTTETLAADEKYLADLKVQCAAADKEYAERKQTRIDEVAAITDAINILSEDDARDVFSKTITLVQVNSKKSASTSKAALAMKRARAHASTSLFAAAQRRGALESNQLVTLAVAAQLDGFSKVKEMMDTMIVELKKQQELEVQKHDSCVADLDSNGDEIMHKEADKKDLETSVENLEGAIAQLDKDLTDLKAEMADTQVNLKAASEQRKAENHEFQQVIADQKATVTVVKKALDRLADFYGLQVGAKKSTKAFLQKGRQEPAGPPPPEAYKQAGAAGKSYAKNSGSTGVMQMLEKVIQDAEQAQAEAKAAENEAEAAYGELVANTNAMLDSFEKSIAEKTATKASTESDKLLAHSDLENTNQQLEDLDGQKQALHMQCDYLVRNFNVRQKARQEEIEAVQQAKQILSGANFS